MEIEWQKIPTCCNLVLSEPKTISNEGFVLLKLYQLYISLRSIQLYGYSLKEILVLLTLLMAMLSHM